MHKNLKKKICFITYQKRHSTAIDNFSQAFCDLGYDVSIIAVRNPKEPAFEVHHGRKTYRISLSEDAPITSRRKKIEFIFKVIPILKRNRFSIIHIKNLCPFIFLLRLFTFNYAKSIYHILSYPISPTYLRSLRHMVIISAQCYLLDKVVIQSEELKENWVGLRKLKKAVVIPVGFNKNDFFPMDPIQKRKKRGQLFIKENESVLVYSGVISHIRNIDKLVMAFKKVVEQHKDVKFLMIGDGDALLDIKALAKMLDIEKYVIFTGRVPYNEVRELVCAADIGMSYIPINNNYNFNPPLKTFEYLACGLPTIATRTESNAKIIKDGFNGILAGDKPEEFANAINRLLLDKNLQHHLYKNSRKSILKYDFSYITRNSFLPLYTELLKKGVKKFWL